MDNLWRWLARVFGDRDAADHQDQGNASAAATSAEPALGPEPPIERGADALPE